MYFVISADEHLTVGLERNKTANAMWILTDASEYL